LPGSDNIHNEASYVESNIPNFLKSAEICLQRR